MKLRLKETEIFVGYEAVAAVCAVLLFDREGRTAACLLSALIHECGHLLTMRILSYRVREIRLRLFDVRITSEEPRCVRDDLLITVSGALSNFLFAPVFFFSDKLFFSNLLIGAFNLLPVESLDGGRLLMILLTKMLSFPAARRTLRIISFVFLVPFLFCGVVVLLNTRYNYSLLAVSLYLLAVLLFR